MGRVLPAASWHDGAVSDAESSDSWACAVGRVAMGQGRVDEWLVQVLILLLAPLTPGVVELLVGADTVGKKCDRIAQLIGRESTRSWILRWLTSFEMRAKESSNSTRVETGLCIHSMGVLAQPQRNDPYSGVGQAAHGTMS